MPCLPDGDSRQCPSGRPGTGWLDADDTISATAVADDVEEGKPAPDPVEHALELGPPSTVRPRTAGPGRTRPD